MKLIQHTRLKESRPTIIQWKKIHLTLHSKIFTEHRAHRRITRGAWRSIKTRQAKSSSQRIKQDVRHVNYTLRTRKWKPPPPRVVVRKIFPKTSRQERERERESESFDLSHDRCNFQHTNGRADEMGHGTC